VDELDEEPDETHDGESDGCCYGDLLELYKDTNINSLQSFNFF
jgi:hypothetical protein